MSKLLLIINPGSTSTKIGVFEDEKQLFEETLRHTNEELKKYDKIVDQFQFRKDVILKVLKEKNFDILKFNDRVAATVACKASIKANDNINLKEMETLVNKLRKCKNPYTCPHGRPTIIFYSNYELEKLFKRAM